MPDQFDRIMPGDIMSLRDQHAQLRAMRERFRSGGWPVIDSYRSGNHEYEHLGPAFQLESGHSVNLGLSRASGCWVAHVYHPGDTRTDQLHVNVNLGTNTGDIPRLTQRELGCRHVIPHLMEQLRGAAGAPSGGQFQRWEGHDAEGAWLPRAQDEGWL